MFLFLFLFVVEGHVGGPAMTCLWFFSVSVMQSILELQLI